MLKQIHKQNALIHCITNPISINDCANLILAFGAKPIMAAHPKEVEAITRNSQALALNLGNFDDVRGQAMLKSAQCAFTNQIPFILDLVGVACSLLRLDFAKELVQKTCPTVLKGNISECKAFYGLTSHASGVDADQADQEDVYVSAKWLKDLAKHWGCIVVCSGKVDIITDGNQTALIRNGCEMLQWVTGTGCMLNVAIATFLAVMDPWKACISATCYYERAAEKVIARGPGSFHAQLFDEIYQLSEADEAQFQVEVVK